MDCVCNDDRPTGESDDYEFVELAAHLEALRDGPQNRIVTSGGKCGLEQTFRSARRPPAIARLPRFVPLSCGTGGVIDGDKHKVPASPPVAAANTGACDAVPGLVEPARLRDIQMDQLARPIALVTAQGLGRVDPGQSAKPSAPEPARDGGPGQLERRGDRRPGHPQGPPQLQDHCRCRICQTSSTEPRQPLAHLVHRNGEIHLNPRRSLARNDAGDDLFSTVNRQAGILVRVIHPCGSPAGVWRL